MAVGESVGWSVLADALVRVDGELDVGPLVEVLVEARNNERLPGVGCAVTREGQTATVAVGYRDASGGDELGPGDRLRLSSMMKPFTAVAVLQLVEENRVGLDEPACRYLTSVPVDPRVTVRHLLIHTGGVVRPGFFHVELGEQLPSVSDFYAEVAPTVEGVPGEAMVYSNHGYALLGQMVADVRGRSFIDVIGERVTAPLGIAIDFDETAAHVPGFQWEDDAITQVPAYLPVLTSASGGWTNVVDLVRLPAALLSGDTSVLRPDTVATMTANGAPPGVAPRGLGWILGAVGGQPIMWHSGGWPGYSGLVALCPSAGLAVAVMINMSAEARSTLAESLIAALI